MSIYYDAYAADGTLIDSGQSALGTLLSGTELDTRASDNRKPSRR